MQTEYSWRHFFKCGHSEEGEVNGNSGMMGGG